MQFVSVDLDFWSSNARTAEKFICRLLQASQELSIPTQAILEHHLGLAFVNKYPSKELVNIDFHSDICEFDRWKQNIICLRKKGKAELNCGTWVTNVAWEKKDKFHWYYPKNECFIEEGRCEGNRHTGLFSPSKQHLSKYICGWHQVGASRGLPHINMSEVTALQFCLSPDYIGDKSKELLALFKQILQYPHVQYLNKVDKLWQAYIDTLESEGIPVEYLTN